MTMYLAAITVSRHIHQVLSWKNDATIEIESAFSSAIIDPPACTRYKRSWPLLFAESGIGRGEILMIMTMTSRRRTLLLRLRAQCWWSWRRTRGRFESRLKVDPWRRRIDAFTTSQWRYR
ncbi:hypothetical protein BT96DRAFT_596866 [Gymnopus androsaceus JB14]|uniref:Uncharacterized protein n=1 Tax=Gymnopus androsaceus JB14 TaxID=1447944 RepID=A0A6A4GIE7_9AGAR|nr:hypothetical protein BT96DRAFT_596866 [Gymnopus androsaceus JB14]